MFRSANDLVACWRHLPARNDRQNASFDHLHTTVAATQPLSETIKTAPIVDGVMTNVSSPQPVDAQDVVDRTHYYSEVELSSMDRDQAFVLPSPSRLKEIRLNAVRELRALADEMVPCCVCELDNDASNIIVMKVTPALLAQMRRCLAPPGGVEIPAFVLSQYDASQLDERLRGVMLFPSAIRKSEGLVLIQICQRCLHDLQTNNSALPPALSIANGNFVGQLPDQFKLTRTDEQAVALLSLCVSLSTVTGGACRTIKSHHYVVENTQGPIVGLLPDNASVGVRVAMVGSLTPVQLAECKKRYALNVPMCRKMLAFLYANNKEYICHRERCTSEQIEAQFDCRARTSIVVDKTTSPDETTANEAMTNEVRDDSAYSRFGSAVGEGEDERLESIWEEKASLLLQPNQSQESSKTDILVRKSNKYVTMQAWEVCVKMFPTLFPGGCGGPLETRRRHLSIQRWIRRCLRVYDHRFERHYAFLLLAFDYLAAENACKTLFVKMHVSATALKASKISRSTLKEAMKYFNLLSECKARGMHAGRPPPDVEKVIQLRRGLRTPESAFYGSNLSRMRARHDLFRMLKRFGPVQLFFTVSPDSAGTYSVAVKSGIVTEQAVRDGNLHLLPNRADRRAIASKHPAECARYFMRVIDTVIDVFLGWDQKGGRPRRGGGIFGAVRAYGSAAETQVAGDLHAHFEVWLHGFPQTSTELHTAMDCDETCRRRLIKLADTVLTTKPPCLEVEGHCPLCHEDETLDPILPGVDAFRRPRSGASPPMTAQCSTYGATFGDNDVTDAAIEALASREDVKVVTQTSDYNRCRPAQEQDTALAVSLVVRDVQIHFWNHSRSCFKVTIQTPKGSVCRFFKPAETELGRSHIDSGLNLRLLRPVGCEYVNAFNSTPISVIKCNHDVQFVLCSEAKNADAYVCKYCIKHQKPVENYAVLSIAAFARAANKASSLPADVTPLQRGRKLLASMLYSVTNGLEIAAPMAALYILRESPFWFSHELVRVDLGTMLQPSAEDDDVEISVSPDACSGTSARRKYVRSQTLLEKYWKRGDDLNEVPFINFCEQYDHSTNVEANTTMTTVSSSRSQGGRDRRAMKSKIAIVCGREIPDISAAVSEDNNNFYYSAMVTLFKTHRLSSRQLFNPQAAVYRSFVDTGEPMLVRQMAEFESRLRDFYKADRSDTSKLAESTEAHVLKTRPPPSTSWFGLDVAVANAGDSGGYDETIPDFEVDDQLHPLPTLTTEKLAEKARASVGEEPNLRCAVDHAVGAFPAVEPIAVQADFSLDEYVNLVARPNAGTEEPNAVGTDLFINAFPGAPTRLERFKECFEPVPWRQPSESPQWTPASMPSFPTILLFQSRSSSTFGSTPCLKLRLGTFCTSTRPTSPKLSASPFIQPPAPYIRTTLSHS